MGEATESRIPSLSESDNTPRANFGELVQVVLFVQTVQGRIHEIGFEQAVAAAESSVIQYR